MCEGGVAKRFSFGFTGEVRGRHRDFGMWFASPEPPGRFVTGFWVAHFAQLVASDCGFSAFKVVDCSHLSKTFIPLECHLSKKAFQVCWTSGKQNAP